MNTTIRAHVSVSHYTRYKSVLENRLRSVRGNVEMIRVAKNSGRPFFRTEITLQTKVDATAGAALQGICEDLVEVIRMVDPWAEIGTVRAVVVITQGAIYEYAHESFPAEHEVVPRSKALDLTSN